VGDAVNRGKSSDLVLPLAALLLALGASTAIRLLVRADDLTVRTLSICNANRHIGLALLLSGQGALPGVAAYALVVPFVMAGAAKLFHKRGGLVSASA
jgi:hypothetical protein